MSILDDQTTTTTAATARQIAAVDATLTAIAQQLRHPAAKTDRDQLRADADWMLDQRLRLTQGH